MDSADHISILVVDDDELIREHLTELIKLKSAMEVIGQASNGQIAIEKAQQLRPDIILMDFQMPVLNGITASRQIIRETPDIRVMLISSGLTITIIKKALEAGIHGLMFKKSVPDQLEHGINTMHKGDEYFCPEVTQLLRKSPIVLTESE